MSEEDVRENVVTYDDEGGGEEDTEAFDIVALRNPAGAEETKHRRDVRPDGRRAAAASCHGGWSPTHALDDADVQVIISRRLVDADLDTSIPPYDSLQTYAYEGCGSATGSVSSLDLPPTGSRNRITMMWTTGGPSSTNWQNSSERLSRKRGPSFWLMEKHTDIIRSNNSPILFYPVY